MKAKSDINRIIGANLRRMRCNRNLSQSRIGAYLGVTFQAVQKYEKGQSALLPEKLRALSLFFGCKVDDFFQKDL